MALIDGSAETRTQLAVDAIVGYLARSPQAADTEQGIAQWWLPRMGVDVPLADVRAALERLVRTGVMTCTSLPEGSVIYRAAAPRP
jgi:hypothetical protein